MTKRVYGEELKLLVNEEGFLMHRNYIHVTAKVSKMSEQ